jgi:hypothetical protein
MMAVIPVFYFPQLARAANAAADTDKVYPSDELTETGVPTATRLNDGNLSLTIRVGTAADSRVGL